MYTWKFLLVFTCFSIFAGDAQELNTFGTGRSSQWLYPEEVDFQLT